MVTRKQVAARLGRSLATVRRLEGVELFPSVDAHGVHHFDPEQVEALARHLEKARGFPRFSNGRVLSLNACGDEDCSNCLRLEQRLTELQVEFDALREEHASQVRSLVESHKGDVAREVRERGELESALAQLLEVLDN